MTLERRTNRSPSGQSRGDSSQIDQELIKQVAEKVYQMWKRDLRIERERQALRAHRFHRSGG